MRSCGVHTFEGGLFCTLLDGHAGRHHGHNYQTKNPDRPSKLHCYGTWTNEDDVVIAESADYDTCPLLAPYGEEPESTTTHSKVEVKVIAQDDGSLRRVVIDNSGLRLHVLDEQLDDLIIDLMKAREKLDEDSEWDVSSNPQVRHVGPTLMLTVLMDHVLGDDDEYFWQLMDSKRGELAWGNCDGFDDGRARADEFWADKHGEFE
jgi:hypothetical protein